MKKIEQTTPIERFCKESLPDGNKRILLHDNITEKEVVEEGVVTVVYSADEYVLKTTEDYSAEYIEENFDDLMFLAEYGETKTARYAELVDKYVRERYSQSAVEAILNNYIADPSDEEHAEEFAALQTYRAECKARAKAEVDPWKTC